MFRTALWAYDQERKAMNWIAPGYWETDDQGQWTDEQLYSALIFHGIALPYNIVIGMMPYYNLYTQWHKYDDIIRLAHQIDMDMVFAYHSKKLKIPYAPRHTAGFNVTTKSITPFWRRVPVARLIGAKVATRFIPVVGWGLFALDMWMVGKWIGEKTNPFDS